MKRIACFLLAVLLVCLCLAGCKPSDDPVTNTNVSSEPSFTTIDTSFDFEDRTTEDKDLTAKGYPPLSLDLQILYQDALEMVRSFQLCSFRTVGNLEYEINGMTCLAITDQRFPTYPKLKEYLQRFFTNEYIYNNLLTADGCVQSNADGLPCVVDAGAAEDATYAGHVFQIKSYSATKIELVATAYYDEGGYTGTYFYETPKNPGKYTTEEYSYTLIFTDNGWRFSQFPFMQ